jgi:hypothetical protein
LAFRDRRREQYPDDLHVELYGFHKEMAQDHRHDRKRLRNGVQRDIGLAKKQAYTEEERRKIVEKGMEAERKSNKALDDRYKDAESEHKTKKEDVERVRKEAQVAQDTIIKNFESQMVSLRKATADAKTAVDASDTPANRDALKKARKELGDTEKARRAELNFEQEKIRSAEREVNIARQQFLDVAEEVRREAQKNERIPEQFKKPSEIAEENIKSSYTAMLRANSPTPAGVDKLADKVAKQLGKDWGKDERRMTKNIVKQLTEKIMDRDEK